MTNNQASNNSLKLFSVLVVFLIAPILLAFDSIVYFLTRPSCLNCGDLIGYIRNGSLTVYLVGSALGYKLGSDT